jgi:hypothetical protein
MTAEPNDDSEALLRALPPAPPDWVTAAEEIPRLQEAVQRSRSHATGDLAAALRHVGLDPDERRLRVAELLRANGTSRRRAVGAIVR